MSATILVIEDNPSMAELLRALFTGEQYVVEHVTSGEEGLRHALHRPPDLIVLDLSLPQMDGFEVLRRLRAEAKTMHVPVIMLTGRTDPHDRLYAFNTLHVNDYLTKPVDNDELLARVAALMYNAQQALLSPLTRLPGGTQIERGIAQRLGAGAPWTFVYIDLDHFKALNDGYGFLRGNVMIRLLADAIVAATEDQGNLVDFVGHIGGEDFVVLTTPDRIHPLCQAIIHHFMVNSRTFYKDEDLTRGAFLAVGRAGSQQLFPLVTISIAVIPSDRLREGVTLDDLSQRAARIKTQSKAAAGNCYIIDGEDVVFCES